jgi:hypothetical protein
MTLNEDLLEIAYHTKGSTHTIDEDLINLSDMKNGETKKIGFATYKLLNGRFVLIQD